MAFKGQVSPIHSQILRSQYSLVCFTPIGCNSLRNSLQPFQSRTTFLIQCPGLWLGVEEEELWLQMTYNPLNHLLSPIKHVKLFQECFSHACIKNKLTKKSSQFVCSSFFPLCLPKTQDIQSNIVSPVICISSFPPLLYDYYIHFK